MRAARSDRELHRAAEELLAALADCADFARVRDQSWLLAESARLAEREGTIDRAATIASYDRVGLCWALCERMDTSWRHLDRGEPGEAVAAAGRAGEHLVELAGLLPHLPDLLERLRGRCLALWHIADALDEACFLDECGDHAGARSRAELLLSQLEQLNARRLLGPDEQETAEAAASRWGARPTRARSGSWAS